VVLSSRCLLQVVEGAVDRLGECAMEEGILDVELAHEPTPRDGQSQHSSDGGKLDDMAAGLVVV
jgi:hypothetical protein